MSISPITSATDGTASSAIATHERAVAQIQQQISEVQRMINDEQLSRDNAVTKAELVQTYTTELDGLQTQLAQLQMQGAGSTSGQNLNNLA